MKPLTQAEGKQAIVVGGGVGGLAAAIRLRKMGFETRLLERASTVGGKLREITVGGRTFDAGPSVLTMRWVFEELFEGRLGDEVPLVPLDPLCRHFFPDGSVLDLFTDEEKSRRAVAAFAGERAARGYVAYRKHAAKIFEIVRGPFMERPLPSVFGFMNPRSILQMTQIDGMRTLWKALEEFFPGADDRLRILFGRYATYNGSSPYHAPATLAVIAHVENAGGIYACPSGLYRLAEALERRARSLGVEIETGVEVDHVRVEAGRATGVRRKGAGTRIDRADVIVCNADVAHVWGRLLDGKEADKAAAKYASEPLSLSAWVLCAVADPPPVELVHHNVFFSTDYRREFRELVDARRPPMDPTVYVCAQDRVTTTKPTVEEGSGERLFFLTNAPPLEPRGDGIDWSVETVRCRERLLRTLARSRWTLATKAEQAVTPREMAERFPSSRGSLYGLSSNSPMAAFKRPANRVPHVAGLYLVGGTAHPGAGLPMVALSARIATECVAEDLVGGR